MEEDVKGHIYPHIDKEKCIDCGACKKVCPVNSPIIRNSILGVYAGYIKDDVNRKISTSGGMAYKLSEHIIECGGVVFGAMWCEYGAKHVCVSNKEDLYLLQGSKYSHSDVGDTYVEAKKYLQKGIEVLYTGTPCQIAGLKSFLRKDYPNLFTIDIVCHGVPSRLVLKDYLQQLETEYNNRVTNVRFRDKNPNQYATCMKFTFQNNMIYKQSVYKNLFFRCFVENYCLRENCYKCQYANKNRVGDLTLADFWGYHPHHFKFFRYEKGTSLILCNTERGKSLLEGINDEIEIENSSFEIAARGNLNLNSPQKKPKDYHAFWKDYLECRDLKVIKYKYYSDQKPANITWRRRVKNFITIMLGK